MAKNPFEINTLSHLKVQLPGAIRYAKDYAQKVREFEKELHYKKKWLRDARKQARQIAQAIEAKRAKRKK